MGTRGSALALAQTRLVVGQLSQALPEATFRIERVTTNGDRDRRTPLAVLGGQGIFVKEIENALLAGEIDLAVHSLKDMPTAQPDGVTIGAVLPRGDPRDALVSRLGLPLDALPQGAWVGTGSLRRQAQLRAYRPDLQIVGLRGNVDTRLRKAATGQYDAIVLAMAGLVRLGRQDRVTAAIPPEIMLPAVGQGAICVEVRSDDAKALELVGLLDDPKTRAAVTAERSFLRELGGGCYVPIAAYATMRGKELGVRGLVASVTGERVERASVSGPTEEAKDLGARLAQQLLRQGCGELLAEEVRRA